MKVMVEQQCYVEWDLPGPGGGLIGGAKMARRGPARNARNGIPLERGAHCDDMGFGGVPIYRKNGQWKVDGRHQTRQKRASTVADIYIPLERRFLRPGRLGG